MIRLKGITLTPAEKPRTVNPFPGLTQPVAVEHWFPHPAVPVRTAYQAMYENTLSPFARARYGVPSSVVTIGQTENPRVASGAATSTGLSSFSPARGVRTQPRQFGGRRR